MNIVDQVISHHAHAQSGGSARVFDRCAIVASDRLVTRTISARYPSRDMHLGTGDVAGNSYKFIRVEVS